MGPVLSAALLLAALAPSARAQSSAPLRGIDVYRSSVLSADEAKTRYGAELQAYVRLRDARRPASDRKAEALRRRIVAQVAALKGIAWVDLTVTEHVTPKDDALYAIFDVVDRADASRLAFAPAPEGPRADPGGLLAAWRRYAALGESLARAGKISFSRPDCPGFYCLWGGAPELDEAQKGFVAGAAARGAALARVLREDADGADRADALYVLSYGTDGRALVSQCREALSDPDARVRGAALQILADVANNRPDLPIALESVLPRLDDPDAAVRSKAMGLLVPLAGRPAYRQVMMTAAPRLAALLTVEQPETGDLAYTLLGMLSGKTYPRRDFAAWRAWAEQAAASRP
ncbi:MAG: HEAT repeat domain-containing protein [Elusimicrobia bacterium]|nr:HEAT repeat domain-containing protein [Elusimicrobiota bacterium]